MNMAAGGHSLIEHLPVRRPSQVTITFISAFANAQMKQPKGVGGVCYGPEILAMIPGLEQKPN